MRQFLSALLCAVTIFFVSSNVSCDQQTKVLAADGTQYQVYVDRATLFIQHCAVDGSLLRLVGNNFDRAMCKDASLVVQPDGNVVVAALIQENNSTKTSIALARYIGDSLMLDSSFGQQGIVVLNDCNTAQAAPKVALQPDGTILVTDAGVDTPMAFVPSNGNTDVQRSMPTRCVTPTGKLIVDKIFCYQGCEPVIFGHRGGVRVMITKAGDQILEEPFCVQTVNEVFPSELTPTEFDNLVSGCEVCCDGIDDDQMTECEKFRATWTALEAMEASLVEKFQETWTILYALNHLDIFLTVSSVVDFAEVFTAIDQSTQILCDKFMQTWTMEVIVDVSEFYTAIAQSTEIICEKFMETWTIIEAIETSAAVQFQETWTAIDGIEQAICMKFNQTFEQIQVIEDLLRIITTSQMQDHVITASIFNILCTDVLNTLTQIYALTLDIEASTTQLQALLIDKFEQTWTMIDTFDDEFQGTWTAIEACCDRLWQNQAFLLCQELQFFQGIFTALAPLDDCASTPITESMAIVTPGTYCVANALSSATTVISIQTSNVVLDLNGYQLATTAASQDVISVNSGLSNITIKNGSVTSTFATTNGIHLRNNTNVRIENVAFSTSQGLLVDTATSRGITVSNCTFIGGTTPTFGINIDAIQDSVIKGCLIRGFSRGMLIGAVTASKITVVGCSVTNSLFQAILLGNCSNCTIQGCIINDNTGGALSHGIAFTSVASNDIVIKNNIISGNEADGIAMGTPVSRLSCTDNCIMNNGGGGILVTAAEAVVDATFTGNTISGNGPASATAHGISFGTTACQRITIENNQITQNGGHGITGLLLSTAIKNNQIAVNGVMGINLLTGSQSVCIENNCITNNVQEAITAGLVGGAINYNAMLSNGGAADRGLDLLSNTIDISIVGNTIALNGNDGIGSGAAGCRGWMIANNAVMSNGDRGITVSLSYSTIKNNFIVSNATIGLRNLAPADYLCTENNSVVHNGTGTASDGISAEDTNGVYNKNICVGNLLSGLALTAAADECTVSNNISCNNGTSGTTTAGIQIASGATQNNVIKNICNRNSPAAGAMGIGGINKITAVDNCSFVANIAHRNALGTADANNYSSAIPFQSSYGIAAVTYTPSSSAAVNNITIIS